MRPAQKNSTPAQPQQIDSGTEDKLIAGDTAVVVNSIERPASTPTDGSHVTLASAVTPSFEAASPSDLKADLKADLKHSERPSSIVSLASDPTSAASTDNSAVNNIDAPSAGTPNSLTIDLATVLGITGAENPNIAFAQAQIRQAYAQATAARVMWLPSLRAGLNYNKHEGRIQEVRGESIETSRGAAYAGLGAGAVGAASPAVPGVYMQFHLSDAVHQPKIAGHALNARRAQSRAVLNDEQLETALAYLALMDAAQRTAIAVDTLQQGEQLIALTQKMVNAGTGSQTDVARIQVAVALARNELVRGEEATSVASARLNEQLSSDPLTLLIPAEPSLVPIDFISIDTPTNELVATGLANRPELSAHRALVCEAVCRLRREVNAPWLPSVVLGVSQGGFGAGLGGDIENGGDRFDLDGIAYWEVRNLGFGEKAARSNAKAQVDQARWREVEQLNQVAREVVEAHAQVLARKRRLDTAAAAIELAQQVYTQSQERLMNVVGSPADLLIALQSLDIARREYTRTVVEYNEAQFRLQRALGWPISVNAEPTM